MQRLVLALAVLGLVASGCGPSTTDKFGQDLFEISCARCHGSTAQGGIGPPIGTAESRAARELSDEQIFGAIRVGPGAMPGNPSLTDEQITSLVEYLRLVQGSG